MREHIMAMHEVFEGLARLGLITDAEILPLRRFRQRGFRRGR